jgi:Lrp/AsnC family leucine-responsive transcriptional regulator
VSYVRQADGVDRQLIEALRANARATFAELARLVGLSAPAVHERVGKLEASGVITGYHAAVEPAALGLGVSALVGILQGDRGDPDRIYAALQAMPEIEDCWFVAGEETFVIKVRVPDMPSLEQVIGALNRIRGVARTRTTVVLSTRFEGRPRPVPEAGAVVGAETPDRGVSGARGRAQYR